MPGWFQPRLPGAGCEGALAQAVRARAKASRARGLAWVTRVRSVVESGATPDGRRAGRQRATSLFNDLGGA